MSEIIRSEQIGDLATALAKAKLNYGVVVRTKENTYTHSKYAELQDLMDAIQKPLATEGLSFVHFPIELLSEKRAGARTLLIHSTGQYIGNELLLPAVGKATGNVEKLDAQTIGAAITYAKRYNVQGLGDVVGESEDDGESIADKSTDVPSPPKPKPAKPPIPISQAKSNQGGERPNDSKPPVKVTNVPALPSEPITITQPATQTNDPAFDEVQPVQAVFPPFGGGEKILIPNEPEPNITESTSSQSEQPLPKLGSSEKPSKSQFDAYCQRATNLRIALEKNGLKPSRGVTSGAKLKNYLLGIAGNGAKDLTDLAIYQWEDFFIQTEQADPVQLVNLIDGGKVG